MVLLLFLAALLSVVGYGYSLNQFLKIPIALSYAVAIAMKVLVLFISGILDVLPFVVYILFVLGLLLLTCSVLRFRDLSPFYHPGTLFMMVCLLVHVFILHDAKLLFFDDFSHWGLMVKEMVAYGGFPDEESTIAYRNYPPAMALFIFSIVTITGFSEAMMLIAQSIAVAVLLSTLFVGSKWKKPGSVFLPLIGASALPLIFPVSGTSLIVDSLLGYAAVASIIAIYTFRSSLKMQFLTSVPLLSLLVLVKDSGKLFFAFIILFAGLLFFRYAKDQSFSSRIAIFISIVVIPIIFDRLWSWQQNQMYDSAYEDNRFAITTGIFQHDRTENYVERLLPDLMALSFNFSSPAFLGFLGILLSLSIGILLMRSSLLKRILIYIVFLYFIYIAFLYILYLFIMPDATVGNLVAFNRYQGSILIFLCGIGVFFLKEALLKQKSNTSNAKLRWTTFSVLLFFVPISTQVNEFNIDPNYDQSNRVPVVNQFKELRAVTDLNHSDHIIIVDVDEESSPIFLRYLVMFERLSRAQTQVQHCDNANEFVEILNSGEYLMLYNYDEGFSDC